MRTRLWMIGGLLLFSAATGHVQQSDRRSDVDQFGRVTTVNGSTMRFVTFVTKLNF